MADGVLANMMKVPAAAQRWADRAGYWNHSTLVVLLMCALVAVRVHEFFPVIGIFKPVVTGSIFGFILLYTRTGMAVRKAVTKSPLARLVFLYFAFMLASAPFGLYPGGTVTQVRGVLPAILMFTAFLLTPPTRENLDRIQFGFVVLILFFAWYVQFFGGTYKGRLMSVSGSFDTNDIASLMSMGLPLSAGVFMRMKGARERLGAALAVAALGLGVAATGSRGGFLAMSTGILVFMLGLRGNARVVGPFVIAILFGILWVTAPPVFRERVKSLTNLSNDYNMTAQEGRKAVWKRGRGYILQYPLLGVGAGNYYIADGANKQEIGLTGKWSTAHNAYLQAYVELGIPGGTVYVILLLTAAGIAFRMWGPERRRRGRGPPVSLYRPEYLAALLSYSAGAYFLSHAYFTPLFALLGMIALSHRVAEMEASGVRPGAGAAELAPAMPVKLPGQRGGLAWTTQLPPTPARGGAMMRSGVEPFTGRPAGIRGRLS